MLGVSRRLIMMPPVARAVQGGQRRHLGAHAPGYVIGGREFSVTQVVLGIIGFYTTLGFFLTSGGKKKEDEAKPIEAAASSVSSEIVSVFDEGFDEWSKIPGNLEKWAASLSD